VGDHGVVFVSARRRALEELTRGALPEAKRFGLSLHFGASRGTSAQLWSTYQAALGAAQEALSKDLRIVISDEPPTRDPGLLRNLREELARDVEARAATLAVRFDRYAESVAAHCAHRMDPSRADLEIAFERISDILLRSGALDPKSLSAMGDVLDRAAGQARNLNELLAAYRRAVVDMAQALERPAPARQDRRLRVALSYIERHYSEKLNLKQVARLSGFAPTYFSELFAKREKRTFEEHLFGLRMERAKQLLTGTDLSATRIAELSGFSSPQYFSRVFGRSAGLTPLEYRYRFRTDWAGKRSKRNRSKDKDRRTRAR
jgi:AraC-like DNA-binding protein